MMYSVYQKKTNFAILIQVLLQQIWHMESWYPRLINGRIISYFTPSYQDSACKISLHH